MSTSQPNGRPFTPTALDGGLSIPQERQDAEVLTAWTELAQATDRALTILDPLHPQRHDFEAMRHDFRAAARLPEQPFLSPIVSCSVTGHTDTDTSR